MKNGFDKTFQEVIDEITLNYEITKSQDKDLCYAFEGCCDEIKQLMMKHISMEPYLDGSYDDEIDDFIRENFSWKWMVGYELYPKEYILENLDEFIKERDANAISS